MLLAWEITQAGGMVQASVYMIVRWWGRDLRGCPLRSIWGRMRRSVVVIDDKEGSSLGTR